MNLRTTRLFLRPIALCDAQALFAVRGDPEVMRYWDWPEHKTPADLEEMFRAHIPDSDDGHMHWWSVAESEHGPAIGECDLSEIDRHHRRAEVGFLFARTHWGKGYAEEAMRAVIDFAFGPLGLERLWARCHFGNDASVKLLERLGFSFEGRLKAHVQRDGRPRDCLIYGLLKEK
jgi:ribosomal-protein-alanine N-acetyltransferase